MYEEYQQLKNIGKKIYDLVPPSHLGMNRVKELDYNLNNNLNFSNAFVNV